MSRRAWLPAVALLALLATRVSAEDICQVRIEGTVAVDRDWPAPLNRIISIDVRDVNLRQLLERVAVQARFRISYSTDLIPLDRHFCVSYDDAPAGQLLSVLLAGIGVDAVVAAPEHVVLAPSGHRAAAPVPSAGTVVTLDPLIVLAQQNRQHIEAAGTTHVLNGAVLPLNTANTMTQLLNGAAPGVWLWQQTGSALQYGSVRGVSSFGISAPKVYIDGIPVANPLVATRFAPGSIERIEVLRGPEGGAQYGGDAISGVTSIITRHDLPGDGVPRVRLRSAMGLSSSDFVVGSSMTQDHALNVRLGGPEISTAVNLAAGNGGVVLPGSSVRHIAGDASLRTVRSNTVITGTLRFFTEDTEQPWGLLAVDSIDQQRDDVQSLRQYTAGVRIAHQANQRWTHTLLAGIDGFSMGGASDAWTRYLSPADSALRSVASAHRSTFRLTSAGQFTLSNAASASLVATAEHSRLRQRGVVEDQTVAAAWTPQGHNFSTGAYSPVDALYNTGTSLEQDITGLSIQAGTLLYDRVTLSSGFRVERHQANGAMPQLAALPTLSAAVQHEEGPIGMRFRFAAGKGIRWPQDPASTPGSQRIVNRVSVEPEQQRGLEAGIDLAYRGALTLQVTRFNQTASKLIQRTAIHGDRDPGTHPRAPRLAFQLQNLGEISNDGWELQAGFISGPLSLSSGLSMVDSRVRQVADGYTGDLRPGDRMLAVPARTLSLSAAWRAPEWSTSLTAYRAFDWVNYDRVALNQALGAEPANGQMLGDQLRGFWRQYDGSSHLRATAARQLTQSFGLWLEIDNLLNRQAGEPDNATIFPGRSFTVGVRASF